MRKTIRRPWTPDELAFLRAHYPDRATAWIAEQLGRPAGSIYQQAAIQGLHKSRAFMASEASGRMQREDHRGRDWQFQPGQTPWNKGSHYVAGGRSAETRFKPGRPAHEARNYKPIGSLRITRDGILERKVTDDPAVYPARRWVAVHRLVWIAAHGPIPPGHIVVFKAGRKTTDPAHIALDDVELITLAENMRRNTVHNLPAPIKEVVDLKRNLVRRISTRERKLREQDHR
jgi:hypothetical protein